VTDDRVRRLRELLQQHRGRCELKLLLEEAGTFRAPMRADAIKVAASRKLKNELIALFSDEARIRFE
jgi:hypothetical protein